MIRSSRLTLQHAPIGLTVVSSDVIRD